MSGQGFKIAIILVLTFLILGGGGMAMVAMCGLTVEQVSAFYIALGALARLVGLDTIIMAWLPTRGQSNGEVPADGG